MLRSLRKSAHALVMIAAIIVECRLPADEQQRVFALVDAGTTATPQWRLMLRSRELGARSVELPLAGVRIERAPNRVAATAHSANGGLDVELLAEPAGRSRLRVFVNFELEVNVWRDLSPDVEHMNTDGMRDDVACVILSPPKSLP